MIPSSPEAETTPRPLDADVERGLRWTAIRQIVTGLAGTLGVLFYARFITPAALGAASLAILVFDGLVLLIREPISHAIVYHQQDEADHPSAAFWLLMAFSLPASVLVLILAPWMARFYGSTQVAGLTRLITVAFLMTAIGTVPSALLLKQMRFRLRESFLTIYVMIQMAGWIAFSVMGYGAWSLILPTVIGSAFWAAATWIVVRFKPVLRPGRRAFGDIFRFSRKLWGSQLLTYLMLKIDNAAVGTLGEHALGLYAFGEDQSSFATISVAAVIGQVMLPALARVQDRIDAFRRTYLDILRLTAAASLPMQIGAIVVADLGITLFFGDQWAGAVPVFRAYVMYQVFTSLTVLSDAAISAMGRPAVRLWMNLAQLPLFIAATAFGLWAWGGILGVAISLAVVRSLAAIVYLAITWRMMHLPLRMALAAIAPSGLAAGLMGLIAWGARVAGPSDPWPSLGMTVGVAVPAYFGLLWIADRAGFASLLRSAVQVFVPAPARDRVNGWIMSRIHAERADPRHD